jgi:hypothetical protein
MVKVPGALTTSNPLTITGKSVAVTTALPDTPDGCLALHTNELLPPVEFVAILDRYDR